MARNWVGKLLDAILTEVRNLDPGRVGRGATAVGLDLSCGGNPNREGVRGGGGGLLPLDGAVALLCPDAVVVNLSLEELAALMVV